MLVTPVRNEQRTPANRAPSAPAFAAASPARRLRAPPLSPADDRSAVCRRRELAGRAHRPPHCSRAPADRGEPRRRPCRCRWRRQRCVRSAPRKRRLRPRPRRSRCARSASSRRRRGPSCGLVHAFESADIVASRAEALGWTRVPSSARDAARPGPRRVGSSAAPLGAEPRLATLVSALAAEQEARPDAGFRACLPRALAALASSGRRRLHRRALPRPDARAVIVDASSRRAGGRPRPEVNDLGFEAHPARALGRCASETASRRSPCGAARTRSLRVAIHRPRERACARPRSRIRGRQTRRRRLRRCRSAARRARGRVAAARSSGGPPQRVLDRSRAARPCRIGGGRRLAHGQATGRSGRTASSPPGLRPAGGETRSRTADANSVARVGARFERVTAIQASRARARDARRRAAAQLNRAATARRRNGSTADAERLAAMSAPLAARCRGAATRGKPSASGDDAVVASATARGVEVAARADRRRARRVADAASASRGATSRRSCAPRFFARQHTAPVAERRPGRRAPGVPPAARGARRRAGAEVAAPRRRRAVGDARARAAAARRAHPGSARRARGAIAADVARAGLPFAFVVDAARRSAEPRRARARARRARRERPPVGTS